jgi:hypothetical protein
MNKHQLRSIIKKTIVGKLQRQGINKYKEYKVLNHVPDLISILTDLMSPQFNLFVRDIEWVAPRPTTFRIVLANDQVFYLIYTDRTWIGKVEGKKYYLLNLSEEQNCVESIARILAYGARIEKPEEGAPAEMPADEPVDTSIAPETPVEEPAEEPAEETVPPQA